MARSSQSVAAAAAEEKIKSSYAAYVVVRHKLLSQLVRDVGTGSAAGNRGNLDRTDQPVRSEGDLTGEEGIDVVPRDAKLQRSRPVGRIDGIVMPTKHAGVGIVLVDAVNLVNVGGRCGAEG